MAMSGPLLAQDIADAMGVSVTPQLICFGNGIVNEIKLGVPGVGLPTGNLISGLDYSRAANEIGNCIAGSVTPEIEDYCMALFLYIMAKAIITYTGPPPPAPNMWSIGGKIFSLVGDDMAQDIHDLVYDPKGFPGPSDKLKAKCGAIAQHIMLNAEVESGVIN